MGFFKKRTGYEIETKRARTKHNGTIRINRKRKEMLTDRNALLFQEITGYKIETNRTETNKYRIIENETK